jgi:hypothetical protein
LKPEKERTVTDDEQEKAYQRRLAEFRRKLSAMAVVVMKKKQLRPLDVAGSFIGCGHGVLDDAFGAEICDRYFAEMVVEVSKRDEPVKKKRLDS